MSARPPLPWYREPWPWILMAGPAIVVVAGIITAWLAISTSDGLVADDYYKQGLAVNQSLQRDREAAARHLAAELLLGDDGRRIRVLLAGDESASRPSILILKIVHPTRPGSDQSLSLRLGADGFYAGELVQPVTAGRWHVRLEDGAGAWRLVADWNPQRQAALRLRPNVTP